MSARLTPAMRRCAQNCDAGRAPLVEIERAGAAVPIMKLSPGKRTYPGRKQVWRLFGDRTAVEDVIELADAQQASRGRPLVKRDMMGRRSIADLPASVHRLRDPVAIPFGSAMPRSPPVERVSRTPSCPVACRCGRRMQRHRSAAQRQNGTPCLANDVMRRRAEESPV